MAQKNELYGNVYLHSHTSSTLATDASGLVITASTVNLSGYVPYTGATTTLNLGAQDLTTTGTLASGRATITGDATNGIRINQGADDIGFILYGYDNRNTSYFHTYIDQYGSTNLNATSDYVFRRSGASKFLCTDTAFHVYAGINLQIGQNTTNYGRFQFVTSNSGTDVDLNLKYDIKGGANNTYLIVDHDGNFDYQSGNLTTTGDITASDVDCVDVKLGSGDEYLVEPSFSVSAEVYAGYRTITIQFKDYGGTNISKNIGFTYWFATTSMGATAPAQMSISDGGNGVILATGVGTGNAFLSIAVTDGDGSSQIRITSDGGADTNYFHVINPTDGKVYVQSISVLPPA